MDSVNVCWPSIIVKKKLLLCANIILEQPQQHHLGTKFARVGNFSKKLFCPHSGISLHGRGLLRGEGNLIIFGLSGNYADSRLFEKWTTLAAWQQLTAAAAAPLSVVATKKQEGGGEGRVVTPCRISYPLFTAEFMSLRGFQRMKIWRAVVGT